MADAYSSDNAIERVLRAERGARAAVAAAQAEVLHIAERARSHARATSQRSERRMRRVVACFERDLAVRLAQLTAEGATLASHAALGGAEQAEHAALDAAVARLARELIGAEP